MKRKTNEQFLNELKEANPYVLPLEEYVNATAKIKFKCLNDCEHPTWIASPNKILHGQGCPKCGREKTNKYLIQNKLKQNGSFTNCYPELASHLVDKTEGISHGKGSHYIATWKCPDCNTIYKRQFSYVSEYGLVCPECRKNDSYPNKVMGYILSALGINYIREYSPDWIKPKRYDFYFELDYKKYIIEMDGIFHSSITALEMDNYKDNEAQKRQIKVIRINCRYPSMDKRQDYILNSILSSDLSKLFDLSSIDLNPCFEKAIQKDYLKYCEMYNNGEHDLCKIADYYRVTKTTVYNALCFGNEHNLCNYTFKNSEEVRINKVKKANGQPVICNETKEIFCSFTEADKHYHCCLQAYFKYKRKYSGISKDGKKLTWSKITHEEFNQLSR